MSLAIPYILDAAAEASPNAVVQVVRHHLTVTELNRRSIVRAEHYLREGYRPGNRILLPPMLTVSQVIDVLAATRIGLVLSRDRAPEPSRPDSPGPDREVAESHIWSEVPVAVIGSRTLTHGEVVEAADRADTQELEALRPLLTVLRAIREGAIGEGAIGV